MTFHHAGRALRRSGERGETLIEVLVTIVMMGVGITAILTGILIAVRVADQNEGSTEAGLAVQNAAEALQKPAEPIPASTSPGEIPQKDYSNYVACANPLSYALPAGVTITQVRYLQDFSGGEPVWDSSVSSCYSNYYRQETAPDAQGNDVAYFVDNGMQEITLRSDSGVETNGRFVDTLVVVKRDQRCPGTFDNADLGPC